MISQRVLGNTEMNIRHTAHGGGHENEDWGGIPVVVLFGELALCIEPELCLQCPFIVSLWPTGEEGPVCLCLHELAVAWF